MQNGEEGKEREFKPPVKRKTGSTNLKNDIEGLKLDKDNQGEKKEGEG